VWPRSVLGAFRGLAEPPGGLARLVWSLTHPLDPACHASPTPAPLPNRPQRNWLFLKWPVPRRILAFVGTCVQLTGSCV